MEEMGKAIGREAQANDVSVVLGPAENIKRSPLCGGNLNITLRIHILQVRSLPSL